MVGRNRRRCAQFEVEPFLEGSEGGEPGVEGGIDEAQADDTEEHGERAAAEADFGSALVGPLGGVFEDGETGAAEAVEEVDIEGEIGGAEVGMDTLDGFASHDLGAALGVADMHPEEALDDGVEHAAGEAAFPGLAFAELGAGEPAGADDAIVAGQMADEVEEGAGRGGAVGIDVADEVGFGGEFETFDEGAAFADGPGEIDPFDAAEVGGGLADDVEGVVTAAIEDGDQAERAVIFLTEKSDVIPEHGSDAFLLVIGGNEEEEAWFLIVRGHAAG